MRSYKLVVALGLVALGGLGLLPAGCSDDTPITLTDGIDRQYPVVQAEVNDMVDSSLAMFTAGLDAVIKSRTADSLGVVDPGDILTTSFGMDSVSASGDWYVLYKSELVAAGTHMVLDSLQFTKSGASQPTAVGADGLRLKHRWTLTHSEGMESYSDFDVAGEFTFSGLNTDVAYVSGHSTVTVNTVMVTADSTVSRHIAMNVTVTNIVMDRNAGGWSPCCPTSGTASATIQVTYTVGTSDPLVTNWNVQLTFIDGSMGAVVSDGTHQEQYSTTLCTVQ